jgi:transposase-like protein
MSREGIEKFRDEECAYEFVERYFWPDGPVCPHCGGTSRIGRLCGGSTRPHTYKCYECRKPFTVKIGTVFEDSKVPMHKWLQAILLSCKWQHRLNARQASLILGVTYKTAAAMLQRVREARR